MRKALTALTLSIVLTGARGATAEDCGKEVQAAFEKQRTQPSYRVVSKQPSIRGDIETQTDFQRPDKMYSKVNVPGEPGALETIAIGRWAWASHGMGFQELQPQFAMAVTSDVSSVLNTPVAAPEPFVCLGKVKRDDRELLAYRSQPKASPDQPVGPSNPELVRTVFVDPATGLPVLNLVSEVKPDAPALVSSNYSYPVDIVIEAPAGAAPAARAR